jgi:pectin methylesterase-like acyl-CoA thioesterase
LFAGAYGATEYFVDKNRPNDNGDGKSEETAFKTIQAALNAAASGDTITVFPGEYKETPVEVADLEEEGKSSKTRLYITKRITLRSKKGASKTHIVGAYDPQSDLAQKIR